MGRYAVSYWKSSCGQKRSVSKSTHTCNQGHQPLLLRSRQLRAGGPPASPAHRCGSATPVGRCDITRGACCRTKRVAASPVLAGVTALRTRLGGGPAVRSDGLSVQCDYSAEHRKGYRTWSNPRNDICRQNGVGGCGGVGATKMPPVSTGRFPHWSH